MSSEAMGQNIREQPRANDPQEERIRGLLEKEFSTDFARSEIKRLKTLQSDFIDKNLGKDSEVRPEYLELLSELAPVNQIIVDGREYLEELPDIGFVVATNHLAMPKATRIATSELTSLENVKGLPEEIEPWPVRLAGAAGAIGQRFSHHEIAIALPAPLDELQKACGGVVLPAIKPAEGRFAYMLEKVGEIFKREKNACVYTYPESGSTGKRGGGGLYGVEKEEFHTGFIRLAQALGVPVVLVAQAFNPNKGFETKILEPFSIDKNAGNEEIQQKTIESQSRLQEALDSIRQDW